MSSLKEVASRIPLLRPVYAAMRERFAGRVRTQGMEAIFTDIFRNNAWRGSSSLSGTGSEPQQTSIIAARLPAILRDLQVTSLLDLPCGDFRWMKDVDLRGIDYTGADVVGALVDQNRRDRAAPGIRFEKLDVVRDELPRVDLVFCRDCLVHFSCRDVFLALANVCASGSRYLLTTTFTDRRTNRDIPTGKWRPLNLRAAPFLFPEPIRVVNEGCTEHGSAYADKSLALWRLEDIRPLVADTLNELPT